jgi:hypothetical protein
MQIAISPKARKIILIILERIPNTRALFWVDFTVLEIFPPGPRSARLPELKWT